MCARFVPLLYPLAAVSTTLSDDAFVTTPSGKLQGFIDAAHGGMRAFRGIPYAKPPVGDLRWREPQAFGKWTGTLNATQFGHTCLQNKAGGWATVEGVSNSSEDCLYLNVVAPIATRERLYPVLVYLHAGEFDYGAASDRESNWPFADDVVLVSPNSRLGVLGYLGSDDLRSRSEDGSTGNYGLADQRLALRWVRDNIAAFGGNASNVIIIGESSGGTSVAAHLVMQESWGLFDKAVLESPGLTQTKPLADAEVNFRYMRDALLAKRSNGCERAGPGEYDHFDGTELSRETLPGGGIGWNYSRAAAACDAQPDCAGFSMEHIPRHGLIPAVQRVKLHASPQIVPASYLHLSGNKSVTTYLKAAAGGAAGMRCMLQANASMMMPLGELVPRSDTFETDSWAPVVDGVALPQSIVKLIGAGKIAPGTALLAGSNMDEGTLFMMLTPKIRCSAGASDLDTWARQFYGPKLGAHVPQLYAKLRQPVPQCSRFVEEEGAEKEDGGHVAAPPPPSAHYYMAAMRSAGDYAITCRVRSAGLRLSALGHSVYTYYFTHTPKASLNYEHVPTLGAFHGAEVPFVFGDDFELANKGEKALAQAMGCYWRNFAHTGDPNTPPPGGAACSGGQPPRWPRFQEGEDETMVLDVGSIAPEMGLKKVECDAFAAADAQL